MMKEKLQLKDDLSDNFIQILYNTEYKNTDFNQFINYTNLFIQIKKKTTNHNLIDPSTLLIAPFFTKDYIDKLNLKIANNQDPSFNPTINKNVEYYLEKYFVYLCRNNILLDKNRYRKSKHPKLSIIIAVYNRIGYIKKILLSIQNQNIKDIVIIFVDDMSKDNGVEIIEKLIKEDERIVLLKNKKNSGTFYSRFAGLIFSKGDYIAFADSDDFFLPDILGNAYITSVKNNVEIVQWNILNEYDKGKVRKGIENHKANVVLTANELKYYMFYEHHENYAQAENFFIWDKIYKKNLLLRTMHKFGDLINEHLCIHDDNLFLFIIFQNCKSYYFINQFGYYWYHGESK